MNEKLTTKDLAELIVDALLRAKIIDQNSVKKAIEITSEEIDVRKAMEDFE